MKHKKILTNLFSGKKSNEMVTVAIIAGVAVGAAIGALFATPKGRILSKKITGPFGNMAQRLIGNTRKKSNAKLGNLIVDVRNYVKQNAEGLKGPETILNPLG